MDYRFCVDVDAETYELLQRLTGPVWEEGWLNVQALLEHLVNSAADGVRRPGSWERGWIVQATGARLD
jgi:hypothetical protein